MGGIKTRKVKMEDFVYLYIYFSLLGQMYLQLAISEYSPLTNLVIGKIALFLRILLVLTCFWDICNKPLRRSRLRVLLVCSCIVFVHYITIRDWTMFELMFIPFCNHYICLNGIDEKNFLKRISQEERLCQRNKLGFSSDDYVFLYCGRLIPEKGVLELIKAVIGTENSKIKLLVVGSSNFQGAGKTEYVKKLERICSQNRDIIVFTGFIPNNNLYKYYQSADCQVICSKCQEAAGLVAVEGSVTGLPIITTDSGGILEYCNSNNTKIIKRHDYNDYDSESEYLIEHIREYIIDNANNRLKSIDNSFSDKVFYSGRFYQRFIDIFQFDK